MGYECDAAIVIKKANKKKLLRMIHKLDDEWDENKNPSNIDYTNYAIEVYKMAEQKETDEYLVLHWNWVKWYSLDRGYSFFRELAREQKIDCDYICVGEDPGDIEEQYKLNSGLVGVYVDQHIVIN